MFKKKELEPVIPNKKELLEEIRNNNCREIMIAQVTLKAMEKEKLLYPEKQEQIKDMRENLNLKLKGLIIGIEVIDKELAELK
jgi:hypothetical protein